MRQVVRWGVFRGFASNPEKNLAIGGASESQNWVRMKLGVCFVSRDGVEMRLVCVYLYGLIFHHRGKRGIERKAIMIGLLGIVHIKR